MPIEEISTLSRYGYGYNLDSNGPVDCKFSLSLIDRAAAMTAFSDLHAALGVSGTYWVHEAWYRIIYSRILFNIGTFPLNDSALRDLLFHTNAALRIHRCYQPKRLSNSTPTMQKS